MKHLDLLGYVCRDAVTGFEGTVDTVSYDLYGCIQAAIMPKMDKPGEYPTGRWFDAKRLVKISLEPVMEVPPFSEGFEEIGASEKPAMSK